MFLGLVVEIAPILACNMAGCGMAQQVSTAFLILVSGPAALAADVTLGEDASLGLVSHTCLS